MHLVTVILGNAPEFREFIVHWGSVGIFIWFLTINNFNPIPSEISLLVIGYLAAHHFFNPILAGAAAVAGCVGVDVGYYYLAKSGNKFISHKLKKTASFLGGYKKKLKDNMPRTLIILCFIPRMRMFGPIIVGGMKLPFRKFLLFDSLGVILFTALYLTIGFIFHESLYSITSKMKGVQNIILIVAVVIIVIVITVLVQMRKKRKAA